MERVNSLSEGKKWGSWKRPLRKQNTGWRSLTRTPAAGRPVLTTPKGLTARAGRADGTHGAPDAPQPLPKLPARLAPCWAQTPQEGVALVHPLPALKPRSLWGVSQSVSEKHTKHRLPTQHLPPRGVLRKHKRQYSWEAQITLTFAQSPRTPGAERGRAPALCLAQGSTALSVSRLLSTGASPALCLGQQPQVTQSATTS